VLADREVAHDLGELVDVTGLDLVAVVLEPAIPVLGHLGDVVGEDGEHLQHGLLVDDASQAGQRRVLTRNHDGHVVVQDLDREVLALLTEHLAPFLLQDLTGPVMWIHDVVAKLELDVLERTVQVLQQLLFGFGNDALLAN
jgi:hypothetical protein